MDELTLTYNAEKMELTIYPIDSSRLHNITEVVRCKDCKGWCPEEIAKRYGADRYCTMTMMPTDADDFCSYGERKDNEVV